MGKIAKKKGIFFTFIAILIMTVFILVLVPQADVSLQKDAQAISTKIGTVDNYIVILEDSYFETVLRATTLKTLLSLAFYANSTGKFLTDFDSSFSEIMINGTINKVPVDSITRKKIMDNSTLINWSNAVAETAKSTYNVNTTIVIINVSVNQTDPWSVTSKLSLNITVKSSVAEWKRSKTIQTKLSLEALPDPYYLVNTVYTNDLYDKRIKQSGIPFDVWNISQVRITLRNSTYVYWKSAKAPSYLMRFVNNTNSSECCGIESLVDPNKISPSDQRDSYVDYLFWPHTYNPIANCTKIYNITNPATGGGIWDEFRYFKLDIDHVVLYNVTSNDAVRNC